MPSTGLSPTFKSHVGIATETTYGTTVATATVFLPVESFDEFEDDQGLVMDEASRQKASKLFGVYTGVQQGAVGYTFPYYNEIASRFWGGIVGADTIGSSSSITGWQHAIALGDAPPSYTIFDFITGQAVERQWVGAQMQSLNFKFERNAGKATIKPSWKSAAPSSGISEQTPTYTSTPAMRGWEAVWSVGASTKVTLLGIDLTLTREVNLVFAGNNSQRPTAAEVGPLDITGKVSWYGSTDGIYTDYRANTSRELRLRMTDTLAGSSHSVLDIIMSDCRFTKVTPDRSGTFIRYDGEFRAVHNATDAGPIQVNFTVATSSSFST